MNKQTFESLSGNEWMPELLGEPPSSTRPRLLPMTAATARSPKSALAVHVPLFQPATARRLARVACSAQRVAVRVEPGPLREVPHPLIAKDRRAFQHGRRTLEERRSHYAIDPRSVVTIEVNGDAILQRDVPETPPERRVAS